MFDSCRSSVRKDGRRRSASRARQRLCRHSHGSSRNSGAKDCSVCEPFESLETAHFDRLLARIGDAKVVLLGEASHGTSEFYRMRDRITRELIAKKGFRFVAIEGDWPDAARVDHYVRHLEYPAIRMDGLCALSDLDVAQ